MKLMKAFALAVAVLIGLAGIVVGGSVVCAAYPHIAIPLLLGAFVIAVLLYLTDFIYGSLK